MRRFLLFRGDVYYPSGGWEDFHSAHDTLDQAKEAAGRLINADWWHVVDSADGEIVERR